MKVLLIPILILTVACTSKPKTEQQLPSDSTSSPQQLEETEEEELARLQNEKEKQFEELDAYNGRFQLYTDSEGAEGSLEMHYLGNRAFKFVLKLTVAGLCEGVIEDTAFVDQTQHAFFPKEKCGLHFNLYGQNIEIDEPEGCILMKGECTFSGTYQFVE